VFAHLQHLKGWPAPSNFLQYFENINWFLPQKTPGPPTIPTRSQVPKTFLERTSQFQSSQKQTFNLFHYHNNTPGLVFGLAVFQNSLRSSNAFASGKKRGEGELPFGGWMAQYTPRQLGFLPWTKHRRTNATLRSEALAGREGQEAAKETVVCCEVTKECFDEAFCHPGLGFVACTTVTGRWTKICFLTLIWLWMFCEWTSFCFFVVWNFFI